MHCNFLNSKYRIRLVPVGVVVVVTAAVVVVAVVVAVVVVVAGVIVVVVVVLAGAVVLASHVSTEGRYCPSEGQSFPRKELR